MKRKAEKKLDKIWAEKVKDRAGNKCEYPGCFKREYLNAHHFYSRSNRALRWELANGYALCSGHHTLCVNSAHKSPADFYEIAIKQRGEAWLDRLREKRNKKFNKSYEEVLQELTQD